MGDRTPDNGSIHCDSGLCGTQVVGTGPHREAGRDRQPLHKLNGIRADRAGGVVLPQLHHPAGGVQLALRAGDRRLPRRPRDGTRQRRVRHPGVRVDHGLIQHTDAYFNGDSGYPGSGSDLNADNPNFKPTRYAIEIRHNKSHDNTLGYSGTAGNSVHAHDNDFYDNATGIATDSLFPGHPGLPQDHARWDHNRIHGNNENWYTKYVDTGVCAKPMKERGYIHGTVCPVVPTPVGTGLLIAGGNFDSTDHNLIYDNWRYGTMQFWVPSPLRDEYDPAKLYDTSNHNHTSPTAWAHPDRRGPAQRARLLVGRRGRRELLGGQHLLARQRTDNFTVRPPSCAAGGSLHTPGLAVKDAGFLSCSQYDRNDPTLRHPPACNWFDSRRSPAPPVRRPGRSA